MLNSEWKPLRLATLRTIRKRLKNHAARAKRCAVNSRTYESRLRNQGREAAYRVAVKLLEVL